MNDKLDFVCIHCFTLRAIRELGYSKEEIDAYENAMSDDLKPGRLRSYILTVDYEKNIQGFDVDKIKQLVGTHYQEAVYVAQQCAE